MTSQDHVDRLEDEVEHLQAHLDDQQQTIKRLERRAERERRRREEAERIAERSTRDLYERQAELKELAEALEQKVEARTADLEGRLRQQTALQEVSQFALRRMDVDDLVEELCHRTADVLELDFCDVFELRPEREELILRAGVGWPEEAIDNLVLDATEGSQSGHTVENWEPTVIEDHREDDRFRRPTAFEDQGIVSGVTVVVPAPENPWGVFGVHARQPRAFDGHDVTFIQSMSRVLSMAIQRQRAQRQLEEEKRRFERLVQQVEEYAIFSCDPNGRVRTWNEGAEQIKGYSEEEILGSHIRTFYTEEDREGGIPERNLRLAAEEGTFEDEGWRVREDGSRFWANVTLTALRDDEGNLQGFSKVTQDMTDRRERERQLEETRRRYETLVENFPNGGVALVGTDLRFEMLGGSPAADIDRPLDEVQGERVPDVIPSPLADRLVPMFERAFEGEASSIEHELRDAVFTFRVVPVRDEGGEIFAAMAVSQDITELKEHERELEASNERLEQFAYAASHDLQEPLRMVSSYLQLLEARYGEDLEEEAGEFIDHAVDGALRMQDMIESLLAYARVRTEGNPLRPVDARGVLEDALSDLQLPIEEANAEITLHELPTVEADPDQLAQVFRNLLSNALKYSGDEPPRVEIGADAQDGMYRFAFRDEGVGIPPDETDAVFEVFQRVDDQEDRGGTGIGLALCEQIVDRHGGEMWVDSQPGEGSTFYFTMPRAEEGGRG